MSACWLALALATAAGAPGRFGRPPLCAAHPAEYRAEKIDEVEFPTLEKEGVAVSALAYRGAKALYVEVVVDNRSSRSVRLAAEPVTVEAGGTRLVRVATGKTAERIEREAVRPFEPKATGGRYERADVERQAREHVARQEREALFAAFLVANAVEEAEREVPAGERRALATAFRAEKKLGEVRVTVEAGGEGFRFVFGECGTKTATQR